MRTWFKISFLALTKLNIYKVTESLVKNLPPPKLFFSVENQKKIETTLIQIPMAHLKITFWQKKN
jgi:hypothetical protein